MENRIAIIVNKAIEKQTFPGCVVAVIKNGKRSIFPFGKYTYDVDARSMRADSIFDVASITKSIPTASLALLLIDRGELRLDDKLISYIPEFQNPDREEVLIWHLLTHTLDFDLRLSSLKDQEPDTILEHIFTARLKSKPGITYAYVNAASVLLGLVIERISRKPLDVFAAEEFFTPLGMKRTTFHPSLFPKEEIAPTEFDTWRERLIQGEVHDESAHSLSKKYIVGSAGLFSTAPDLLTFLQMLLYKGTYKRKKYISEEMIKKMYTNQLGKIGTFGGLGWELCQPWFMGDYCGKETCGKTGFTGCSIVCDMTKGIAFVILSNSIFPQRKSTKNGINAVRRSIADAILQR